jgi:hypothetical protein
MLKNKLNHKKHFAFEGSSGSTKGTRMTYLKYYFWHDGKTLFLDSLSCVEGKPPVEPADFLKWYEEGDFVFMSLTNEQKKAITEKESPLFAAIFSPKEVSFSVNELLTNKYVKIHGEQCRKLIVDSLAWLDVKEPVWGVKVDRHAFVCDLVKKAFPV